MARPMSLSGRPGLHGVIRTRCTPRDLHHRDFLATSPTNNVASCRRAHSEDPVKRCCSCRHLQLRESGCRAETSLTEMQHPFGKKWY